MFMYLIYRIAIPRILKPPIAVLILGLILLIPHLVLVGQIAICIIRYVHVTCISIHFLRSMHWLSLIYVSYFVQVFADGTTIIFHLDDMPTLTWTVCYIYLFGFVIV